MKKTKRKAISALTIEKAVDFRIKNLIDAIEVYDSHKKLKHLVERDQVRLDEVQSFKAWLKWKRTGKKPR